MQYDLTELIRLAQSPAGQRLLALLQQNGPAEVNQAVRQAAQGDLAQAKEAVSALLKDPRVQALLKQMEGQS